MKIVIVGASRGLGLSLVRECLAQGHHVIAGSTQVHPSSNIGELLQEYPQHLHYIPMDVTDESVIQFAAKSCQSTWGSVDALCNCAGILLDSDRNNTITACDLDDLRQTFEVNTLGAIALAKHFIPLMTPKGLFITITSEGVGVDQCGSWIPAYSLSKSAATKAMGILRQTIDGVQVYAVHPGRMNTDMGRTTAQIQPEETAQGILAMMDGSNPPPDDHWYIDYRGQAMKLN